MKLIYLDAHEDSRGIFVETYDRRAFSEFGIDTEFVQESWSRSDAAGTVRGLHFQAPPRAQHKLVRCARGKVFDVVVDVRRGSTTFGQHVSVVLDAESWCEVLVPIGFAHGFCTLKDGSEVTYLMSDHFSPEHSRGVCWDDPDLAIEWPVAADRVIVSDRDLSHPRLQDVVDVFGREFPS